MDLLELDDEPTLCPFCGAYSTRSCDLIDDAGFCAWEEIEGETAAALRALESER